MMLLTYVFPSFSAAASIFFASSFYLLLLFRLIYIYIYIYIFIYIYTYKHTYIHTYIHIFALSSARWYPSSSLLVRLPTVSRSLPPAPFLSYVFRVVIRSVHWLSRMLLTGPAQVHVHLLICSISYMSFVFSLICFSHVMSLLERSTHELYTCLIKHVPMLPLKMSRCLANTIHPALIHF